MLEPVNDSPELTVLERLILETALTNVEDADVFHAQLRAARVVSRTGSGVGFVTKLLLPADAPAADEAARLPTVLADHPDLPSGAEFILDVKSGRLNCIEAFSFEGMWPTDDALFQLRCGP